MCVILFPELRRHWNTSNQREIFVAAPKIIKFNFTLITSSDYIWILLRRMAYRGQGQKVQKVMVQPIVSFQTAELCRLFSFVLIYFGFIILYWIRYYIIVSGSKNAESLMNKWDYNWHQFCFGPADRLQMSEKCF